MNTTQQTEIKAFTSIQRGGRIKITTYLDCLPPDAIKTGRCTFSSYDEILATAEQYWNRGHEVCVDTERGLVEYEH